MANTIKDLSDGDIVRECLASFHNKQTFLKCVDRQYDKRFAVEGGKNGGALLIRNPNWFTVRTGAVQDVQPITESTQTLTVATQYGVDVEWSSVEETMSIDDFRKRIIDPQMSVLAGTIEYNIMNDFYKSIWNYTGTPATTVASLGAILNAGARLKDGLAPEEDLHFICEPAAMAATIGTAGAYFHPASELERGLAKGKMGMIGNMNLWESASIPTHTNGARDDTTPIMDISTIANGATTITTTGADGTLKEGDVFTIADIYAVNLETKQPYTYLQQFVVTEDKTLDATDVIAISPTIYKSGAQQNVYCSSWAGNKALVFVAAGGSGAASTAYRQPLAFHRNAIAVVFTNLTKPYSGVSERATIDGISMRLWKDSDIKNDTHSMRLDVLCGWKAVRPEWACRVRG